MLYACFSADEQYGETIINMFEQVEFDVDLIRRYDRSGPRYTY